MTDVTDNILVQVVSTDYDRKHKRITLGIRLRNMIDKPLTAPLKLRITNIWSREVQLTPINADDLNPGRGPVWDLGATLPSGILLPNRSTEIKTLEFSATDPLPEPLDRAAFPLGQLRMRVYSGTPNQ